MPTYHALGLMSGTSLDGVDLAYARFEQLNAAWQWEILAAATEPYPAHWQQRLASAHHLPANEYAKLHVDYGHYLGMLARRFLLRHGLAPDVVCSHGHTVFHQPERHFTAQLGDGETLATHLSYPVVTNLRNRDVALGGQGAPLVPFGEQQLFANYPLLLNLGGIANLSIFPKPHWQAQGVLQQAGVPYAAYDVAPCNMVLNWLAQQQDSSLAFDAAGKLAATGQLLPDLLAALEGISFYHLPPPRSLGREWVEAEIFPLLINAGAAAPNLLHTFVAHLGLRIAAELHRWGATTCELLITGGGAHNTYLMQQLHLSLAPLGITLAQVPRQVIDFKEALIFAFLGLQRLLGNPNVLAVATGAIRAASSGSLHLPEGYSVVQ